LFVPFNYTIIFTKKAICNDGISIEFPDLPGCLPCGNTTGEAVANAKEALALHLYGMEEDNDVIPEPTDISKLKLDPNQFVVMVEAWMPPFRDEMKNKAVKKTLTIPKWLDDLAVEKGVNFSRVLQETLRNYLGVKPENQKRN
jgi:predicted RNase H-like HicB family nuclease